MKPFDWKPDSTTWEGTVFNPPMEVVGKDRLKEVEDILKNAQDYLRDADRKLFVLDNLRSKLLNVIETATQEHQALVILLNGQQKKTESTVDEFHELLAKYALEESFK